MPSTSACRRRWPTASTPTSRSSTSAASRAGPPRRATTNWSILEGYRPDDFESHWSRLPDADAVSLRAGRDFDVVVLAIPVGMHHAICGELIANPRTPEWRAMTDHLGTVATRSMQLWLRVNEAALGWQVPDVTVSGYPGAFHTYAAMSELHRQGSVAGPTTGPRRSATSATCTKTADPPPADDDRVPGTRARAVARRARSSSSATTCATSGRARRATATSGGTC